ncbi:MAG: hypothetical protein ACI90M_003129 [Candidatus Azotimanducaceae bacterium]|jgi:hypothetical protein
MRQMDARSSIKSRSRLDDRANERVDDFPNPERRGRDRPALQRRNAARGGRQFESRQALRELSMMQPVVCRANSLERRLRTRGSLESSHTPCQALRASQQQ